MNAIDKMIGYFSPKKALERVAARVRLDAAYMYSNSGASRQKNAFKGFKVSNSGPKTDIENNIEVLRARSRELFMGNPLATGAIKKIVTNVVGAGLIPKASIDAEYLGLSQTEAEKIEKEIEEEFRLWASTPMCDASRSDNFNDLQQLALISTLMNGDCFAAFQYNKRPNEEYGLKISLIEGDRIINPPETVSKWNFMTNTIEKNGVEIVNGIEFKNGELEAYHIATSHPGDTTGTLKIERVEVYGKKSGERMILHLYQRERIGQKRGVPILAPVIEALLQLGRYTHAELTSAVVGSLFTAVVESESEDTEGMFGGEAFSEEEQIDSDNENSYELGHGTVLELAPGQKMKEINPGRANTGFDLFVKAVVKQIGSALEIPYEVLMSSFEHSYSASRGALLEAWKLFKTKRIWLTRDFCQPIYEMFLTEAVANGRISAPGFFLDKRIKAAYCKAEWYGPAQGQLDPLKEVMASAKKVEFGFSTYSRETAELTGMNWDHNISRRNIENKKLKTGGNISDKK